MRRKLYVRNLQLTGRTTYTISLPKEWVKSLRLNKGSKLYIEILSDGSLKIYASYRREKKSLSKEIFIEEDDLGSLIRRVIAAYLAGFSNLTLRFDPKDRELAMNVRRILESSILGFSVLKESRFSFTFYSVIDEESIDLRDAIFKLYEGVYYMMDDAIEGMDKRDAIVLKSVIDQDQLVDKLYLFVVKQITSILINPISVKEYGIETAAEAPYMFLAVKSMERIADHVSIISARSASLISEGQEIPDHLVDEFRNAKELFDESSKAFLNPDAELASKAAKVIDEAAKLMREEEFVESRFQIIVNSINRILGYSLDIAETAIDIQTIREAMRKLGHA